MRSMFPHALKALLLAVALGASSGALAQATPNYSDTKLQSFVDAAKKVDNLIEKWNPRIKDASTPEQAQELREQAETEAVGLIEQTKGISVDEYIQISQAARADAQLAARIEKIFGTR